MLWGVWLLLLLFWIQGSIGYKNSRRGTTFAAQSVGQAAAQKARELGMKKVRVKLKGLGTGRQVKSSPAYKREMMFIRVTIYPPSFYDSSAIVIAGSSLER